MSSDATTLTDTGAQPPEGMPGPTTDSGRARSGNADRSVRWWLLAALVVGYLLHLGWRLWLTQSVPTPIAHADEDRYLLSARVLAGGPGGIGHDTEAFRRMGYPMLLAPIYWLTNDPFKVYHAAQAIGIVVNALTFPLLYLFGRRVLGIESRRLALGLAFVAATLPAVAYYSEFALTDVLFAPIGLGWLLLLHTWLTGRTAVARVASGIGAGALVGYAFVVHVRGLVMLGIHVLVLAALVFERRTRWKVALASGVSALVVTQLTWVTDHLVGNAMTYGGAEPAGPMLKRVTSALGLVHIVCDAAGQIWYAGVGTWGLAAVGLLVAVARVRGKENVDLPQRVVLATALATTVCIALSSAAALPLDERVSNHAYVRYIAFLLPVWVMLAVVALIGADRARALRLVGMAAAVIGSGAFLVLSQMSETNREWFHPFDTPEVSFLTSTWKALPVVRASLTALVILTVLALALAARRDRRWAVAAIASVLVINVAAMEVVNARAVRPMSRAEYQTAPQLVRDVHLGPGDVVVEALDVAFAARLNHQREVYWAAVPAFDHRADDPPADATAVIAPWKMRKQQDWDGGPLGWRRVGEDPVLGWAIWLRAADPRVADR